MTQELDSAENDPLLAVCRELPGVTEDVKWGDNLVMSVAAKMFAVFQLPDRSSLSLKVDSLTFDLLVQGPGVVPAPYLARHSWILLTTRDVMPEDAVADLLVGSHALVAAKLSKRLRSSLGIDSQ